MLKYFLAILLACTAVMADVPDPDFGNLINRLPGQPLFRKYQVGTKMREMHTTALCVYDYATQGGASSTAIKLLSGDLKTACLLPGKAVIRGGFVDVTVQPTAGASTTLALGSGNATNDLKVAADVSAWPVSQLALVPTEGTVASYVKLPLANSVVSGHNVNAYQPTVSVGTASLTGGHFRVFIDYVLSE